MSQGNLKQIVSKLRYNVGPRRKFSNPLGPEGRLLNMRKTVTALFKYERIELNYNRADESRGYAERLISDAIRYGENHKETMEMATYWLMESNLVHKLFKVLVPRYQNCKLSYTKMWRAPRQYPGKAKEKSVLELRGNIYPSLAPPTYSHHNLLHNILLDAARKEYEYEKKLLKEEKAAEANLIGNEEDLNEYEDESSDECEESCTESDVSDEVKEDKAETFDETKDNADGKTKVT